jgi:hypothetical protein
LNKRFNRNKYDLKQEATQKYESNQKFHYTQEQERCQSHKVLNSNDSKVQPSLIKKINYPSNLINDFSIQEKSHYKNLIAKTNDNLIKIPLVASTLLSNLSDQATNQSTQNLLKISSKASNDNYIQLKQYRLKFDIGKGSYGIVKLAYNQEDDKNYVSLIRVLK